MRAGPRPLLVLGLVPLLWGGCRCAEPEPVLPQRCEPYWLESLALVDFGEVPEEVEDYRDGLLRRDFTVVRTRAGLWENQGRWSTVFDYQSGWVAGQWRLETAVPWQARDLTGRKLRWESLRTESGCGPGGLASVLAEDVLRADDGRLLLAVIQAPLSAERRVPLLEELTPELSAEWREVGCEPHRDSLDAEARTVGLVLKVDGVAHGVALGERIALSIGGRPYRATVALAERQVRYDCGTAAFVVYAEEFLVQPHGTLAPDAGLAVDGGAADGGGEPDAGHARDVGFGPDGGALEPPDSGSSDGAISEDPDAGHGDADGGEPDADAPDA